MLGTIEVLESIRTERAGDQLPGNARLLTLIGPGGVGKTRLGPEVALAMQRGFAAAARFVSLVAVRRGQDVPAAVVQALRIVQLSRQRAIRCRLAAVLWRSRSPIGRSARS